MCPPLAFFTTLILLCMEFTSALIFLIGMFSHSSNTAVSNYPRVLGGGVFRRLLTRLSSSSHKCSIGDKSGLCTVASRVVQCCTMSWLHEDRHYHAGKSFDAVALTVLRQDEGSHLCILPLNMFPGTTINGDFTPCEIPPHTITDPPPYLSLSKTQASANRSPRRRYRRRRPSARKG